MPALETLNPTALAIAIVIVAAQIGAFLWTWLLAVRMGGLFDISAIAVSTGTESLQVDSSGSVPGFTLTQKAESHSAVELVAAIDSVVRAAKSVQSQLHALREAVLDLVDRYEDRVSTIANVPIYLGLVGTFAGVMSGVFQIIVQGGLSEATIRELLAGVFVAMFSSLVGVLLMIASNALIIPRARDLRDRRMTWYLSTVHDYVRRAVPDDGGLSSAAQAEQLRIEIGILAESFERLGESIRMQQQLLGSVLPSLEETLRDFEAGMSHTTSSMRAHASDLYAGDMHMEAVARNLQTLPAILEALRGLAPTTPQMSKPESTGVLPESSPYTELLTPTEFLTRSAKVRLVAIGVFAFALASLQAGLFQLSNTDLGAGLAFGGALLAYEAIYVVLRDERRQDDD